MSIRTWKKEFYPIDADETTKAKAIEHSLKKWIGLRKANLEKHRLQQGQFLGASYGTLVSASGPVFTVDSRSCSLCFHYLDKEVSISGDDSDDTPCTTCPLYKANGKRSCVNPDGGVYSPYTAFVTGNDPEPMIALLEKALARQKKKK
jgi:hypothetical protein